jgi:hypothetical protein
MFREPGSPCESAAPCLIFTPFPDHNAGDAGLRGKITIIFLRKLGAETRSASAKRNIGLFRGLLPSSR